MKIPTISKKTINLPALNALLTYKEHQVEVKMKRKKNAKHTNAKSNVTEYGSVNNEHL